MIPVQKCYENRFSKLGVDKRNKIWETLCKVYFQKFIKKSDVVMDLGAGYCEFINNIDCFKKYAVDINPDTKKYAKAGVTVIQKDASSLPDNLKNSVDVVFMSNFLEHLNSKDEVLEVILKAKNILKKGGRIMILQPNIDLVKEKYWDFFDHKTALNESSLGELMDIAGFKTEIFIKRFLPYSAAKNRFPTPPFIIRLYLALPSLLRPLAGQSFIVANKK
ncbi:MAG: class I SAM-dependent methyltransferase [Candidatus Levyibacteriota bacterium]